VIEELAETVIIQRLIKMRKVRHCFRAHR
jgi:hypothetical protein